MYGNLAAQYLILQIEREPAVARLERDTRLGLCDRAAPRSGQPAGEAALPGRPLRRSSIARWWRARQFLAGRILPGADVRTRPNIPSTVGQG